MLLLGLTSVCRWLLFHYSVLDVRDNVWSMDARFYTEVGQWWLKAVLWFLGNITSGDLKKKKMTINIKREKKERPEEEGPFIAAIA